jgi:ribonucleotide monophosphatase NagD (HAD superfamily)
MGAQQMSSQQVPIFFSNPDFEFSNEFIHTRYLTDLLQCRFAQGAFKRCLELLYKEKMDGKGLEYTQFGKPETVTYEYARDLFPLDCETVYAVGDNPDSDIDGAKRYGWNR